MIELQVVAALRDGWVLTPMAVTLRYDPAAPLAVVFRFTNTEWTFSRDLLRDGVLDGGGIGDVVIRPVREGVQVDLRSDKGKATMLFRADDLIDFLDETTELVPYGEEAVDVDALIREVTA